MPRITVNQRGFTLIELLVGMMLTSIVVFATYMIFATSSENFHHQELTSENNNNVRFALDVLHTDIARAGNFSTRLSSSDVRCCPKPSFEIPGVFINSGQSIASSTYLPDGLTFDELLVVGDMTGRTPFHLSSISGNVLTLIEGPITGDTPITNEEFESIFAPPRMIRLTNPDGVYQFSKVSSVNGAARTVTVVTPPMQTTSGSCGYMPLAGENHEVNAVTAYLYTLDIDPNAPSGAPFYESETKSDLVRYRVDLTGTSYSPVDSSRVVIAEYVVGLQFMALGGDSTGAVILEDEQELLTFSDQGSGAVLDLSVSSQIPRARAIAYRIQSRTRRPVPRRLAMPDSAISASAAEKGYFSLGALGVAEVRTVQNKVLLPNIAP